MAIMLSPCNPCCSSCEITVTVTDLCLHPVPLVNVTIKKKGSTAILDQGKTGSDGSPVVLKPSSYGWYTITATMSGYQTTSIDVYACDACQCFIPKTLFLYASVNLAQQEDYFANTAKATSEPPYYALTYGTRPAEIPTKLSIIDYDPETGGDSTDPPSTITLPAQGWFSNPIPGTHAGVNTNFYFYLWISQCTAKVMVIDISGDGKYKAGAISSVATYSITQCQSPCVCPYVPPTLDLSVDMSARIGGIPGVGGAGITVCLPQPAQLTYQTTPNDVSQHSSFLPMNLATPTVPQKGWYSDVIPSQTLPYAWTGLAYIDSQTITLPEFRYYLTCVTGFGVPQFELYGLFLNGQSINQPPQTYFSPSDDKMFAFGNNTSRSIIPPTYSCNPFKITGFAGSVTGYTIPITISGVVGDDAIEMTDFFMSRNQDDTYLIGAHGSDDLQPDISGNIGVYT